MENEISNKKKKQSVKLMMNTDWFFEEPIDSEHKQYKLLGYFQKMNEKLDKFMIYPMFIELSLHLANVTSLIKDNRLMYTNKKFKSKDDELLISDLKFKNIPTLSPEQEEEYKKTLTYSAPKIYDYFNITKSLWTVVYDDTFVVPKKNKDKFSARCGFMYYKQKSTGTIYVWEFKTELADKKGTDYITRTNLIYEGDKSSLTIPKILSNFSVWNFENRTKLPVFEVTSKVDYPIEETLLPIFKRKVLSYINQSILLENYAKEQNDVNQ